MSEHWALQLADELDALGDDPHAALSPQEIAAAGLLTWTESRRVLQGRRFSFIGHEYLRALYEDNHPSIVIRKGSQVGASEWALSRMLWVLDRAELVEGRTRTVIYYFPTDADVSEFSKLRLTPAVNNSPYLRKCMAVASRQDTVQMRLMHGRQTIMFRGMRSTIRTKSVPADMLVFDELDEIDPGAHGQAEERLGHTDLKWTISLSTPTIPGTGVDAEFEQSDQRYWFVRCRCTGGCSPDLTWPDCVHRPGRGAPLLRCPECGTRLDVSRGRWRPTKEHARHGYHISRLIAGLGDLEEIVGFWDRREQLQRLYNHKLGLPFCGAAVPIPRSAVLACIDDWYGDDKAPEGAVHYLGCDVGAVLHVTVGRLAEGVLRVVHVEAVESFADLDDLMRRFDVTTAVVDAQPETHGARDFANRFPGRVWLCRYDHEDEPPRKWDSEGPPIVHCNRTMVLDELRDRVVNRRVRLPGGVGSGGPNLGAVRELVSHCANLTRGTVETSSGRQVARYGHTGPDHYAHSLGYLDTATQRGGFFWSRPVLGDG